MVPSRVDDSPIEGAASEDAAEQYKIEDITLFDPKNRKVRIAMIGAGVSGILMAYYVKKHLQNYEFVVYERNADIGGTWLLNRYPGCACDIPSHAYQYAFALNPDWPSFFSPSENIWSYLDRVCKKWDLRAPMKFNTDVIHASWSESSSTWILKMRQTDPSGSITEFTDECDILLHATGVLNNYKWPTIPGIEKFKGKLIHTARWPEQYQSEEWAKETVAMIGSGSSSIQTVPVMQPYVKHMDIFIRTPIWFVEIAGNNGLNSPYTPEQIAEFHNNPDALVKHAKWLEDQVNSSWDLFLKDGKQQEMVKQYLINRTSGIIKKKEILENIIPKWAVGCRRITPGDPYMHAIQEENVDVHFTEVVEITETGLKGKNGVEKNVDTIVCATGFDTSFRPAFPIVGRNGVDLAEKWKTAPEAYLGLAVPDMPNFFTFIGPSWPIGNGSVMGPLEAVGDYVIKFIKKFQGEGIRSFEPKQDVTDQFNVHVQEYMKKTVWVDDCRSWYKDNDSGRVNAVWPGSSLHYIETIESPRYEDFNWTYTGKNMWHWLGMGHSQAATKEHGDKSPYISVENIDKEWLEGGLQ